MKEIKVVGHKIPDTDCTLSAIIIADYLTKKGYKATPYIQGKLNKETEFILNKLGIQIPEIATNFPAGTNICLVDHNEKSQTLDNLDELNVKYVIDHHKVNFSYANPLYMRFEPICSTCSITYKMYKEAGFDIEPKIADLMLTGILSDSLMFRSATTTKEDTIIAEELLKISNIKNMEKYAIEMFDAKSDLGDISIENLIKYDYKVFETNGKKIGIGTLETTNSNYALGRKKEILEGFKSIKEKDGLNFIMLSIVDIIKEKNTTIILNEDASTIEKVFDIQVKDNLADLGNRLSRKKQVMPQLTEYFSK